MKDKRIEEILRQDNVIAEIASGVRPCPKADDIRRDMLAGKITHEEALRRIKAVCTGK